MNWIWSRGAKRIAWVLLFTFIWDWIGVEPANAAIQTCKELRSIAMPQSRSLTESEMANIVGGGCASCGADSNGTVVNLYKASLGIRRTAAGGSGGVGPINPTLFYNSCLTTKQIQMVPGWVHSYSILLGINPDQTGANVEIEMPEGKILFFTANNPDWQTSSTATFTGFAGVLSQLSKVNGVYQLAARDSVNMDQPGHVIHTFGPVNNEIALLGTIQLDGVSSSVYVCSLEYASGNVSAAVDAAGNRTTFNYISGTKRISSIQTAGNIYTTFQYTANTDSQYDLTSMVLPTDVGQPGATTVYSYDTGHRMVTSTAQGNTTTYTYSSGTGQLIGVCDPLGNRTTYSYPAPSTAQITYPTGAVSTAVYSGKPVSVVDAAGNKATYTYTANAQIQSATYKIDGQICTVCNTYDSFGRKTKVLFLPSNTSAVFTYNSSGDLQTVTNAGGEITSFTFDNHRLSTMTSPLGYITTYSYGANDVQPTSVAVTGDAGVRVYTLSYIDGGTARGYLHTIISPSGRICTTNYDWYGNLNSFNISPAVGVVCTTTLTYRIGGGRPVYSAGGGSTGALEVDDRLSGVVYPDGSAVQYVYDCCHLTGSIDENGNVTSYGYWPDGSLAVTTAPSGAAMETSYGYVQGSAWKAFTNADGKTTTCIFDARGLVSKIQYADNTSERYTYEESQRIKTKVDASGFTTTYSYNSRGLLVGIVTPNGPATQYYFDNTSRVIGMSDSSGSTSYSYYPGGWLKSKSVVFSGASFGAQIVTYTYCPDGTRRSMSTPGGRICTYHYDADGSPSWTEDSGHGGNTTYTYDGCGMVVRRSLNNGAYTSYYYDSRNRLIGIQNIKSNGSVLSSFNYYFSNGGSVDAVGNVLNVVQRLSDGNVYTCTYTYDNDYRLTSEYMSGPTTYGYSYTYDNLGNRTSLTVDGGGRTTYYYNEAANNELSAEWSGGTTITYTYDSRGNTLARAVGSSVTSYCYDDDNRLSVVRYPDGTSTGYGYDGSGTRVKKVNADGSVRYYLYDGLDLIAELNSGGNVPISYSYGQCGLVHERVDGGVGPGSVYYVSGDRIGSVYNLASLSTDSVVATETYSAFGNVSGTDSVGNPFRYAGAYGYYNDSDSGLMLLWARYYSASDGRFLTIDPARDGSNWYVYTADNPVRYVDPSGLSFWDGFGAAVIIDCGLGLGLWDSTAYLGCWSAGMRGADLGKCTEDTLCDQKRRKDKWENACKVAGAIGGVGKLGESQGWWGRPRLNPNPNVPKITFPGAKDWPYNAPGGPILDKNGNPFAGFFEM